MALINTAKPTTTLSNASRISNAETWASISSTWTSELRSWSEVSSLLENAAKSLEYNYIASSVTFSNSTLTGAATSLTLADDVYSGAITLPFTFEYYGRDTTIVYVGSNGVVAFEQYYPSQFAYFNEPIETNTHYRSVIYGFGTDLLPSLGGTIKYQSFGSAPNRVFVVEYLNIQTYYNRTPVSTQIKLFETTNNIEIHTLSGTTDLNLGIQGICDWTNSNTQVFSQARNAADFTLTNDGVRFSTLPTFTNLTKPS